MRNPEKERLEAKLKLWETPGFMQFIVDLYTYMDNDNIAKFVGILKNQYMLRVKELEEAESKFKQGKLEL